MDTSSNHQALPGHRGHRPKFDARPVNAGDGGRWGDCSPELGAAPWWADDANVDGCETPLRSRVSPFDPDYLAGETEHEYAQRLLREHGVI